PCSAWVSVSWLVIDAPGVGDVVRNAVIIPPQGISVCVSCACDNGMVTIWGRTISIRYQGPICTGGSHTVAAMGELGCLRRAAATAVSIVLLTLGGLLLAEPAQACACGGTVTAEGEQLTVDREIAALAFDGRTEDVVMQLDMTADGDDAAVIIPTPAAPDVQLADEEFFADLEAMSAPRVEYDYTWWPQWGAGSGEDSGPAPVGGVEVLDTVPLGPLEAAVLSATDADGLTDWLGENDYVMSDVMADALSPYVSEGWYFVAIRLVTEQGTLSGQVQPVHLSFAAGSLIYPMRISAAAQNPQLVTTYVIADGPVRH